MVWGNEMGRRKDRYGSRQVYISANGVILGLARDLFLEGFSGPTRGPQILHWAAEQRVPELALAHNQTDEYILYFCTYC